jgi:hypothetical protein
MSAPEAYRLGDCRPDYRQQWITQKDIYAAVLVLIAMLPCFLAAYILFSLNMCHGCGLD